MTFSSTLTKCLIGAGAVSTVAVGGVYLYTRPETYKNIDDFASRSNGVWSLKLDSSIKTSDIKENTNITIVAKLQDQNRTWICNIKGIIKTAQSGNSLEFEKQLETLKKEIGIKDNEKRDTSKNEKFQKFLKNCIRHRSAFPTEENSLSTIDLGELKTDGNKYAFKDEEFSKLYGEEFLSSKLKEDLGISSCTNLLGNSSTECSLDKSKLEGIKFKNKENTGWTATESRTAKLKVEKTEDINTFPNGLRFIFETSSDIDIKKDDNNKITLKSNTNPEFKLTEDNGNYVLEKALDIAILGSKVGLNCLTETTQECSLAQGKKLKIFRSPSDHTTTARFADESKKITYAKDVQNYNQGFKLTVSEDINLKNSNKSIAKLTRTDMAYEIKLHNLENGKQEWFLTETPEKEMTNLPDKCKISSKNSCDLTKEEFKKLHILYSSSEEWNNDLNISGDESSGDIISISWSRLQQTNNDFPLGLEFLVKSKNTGKTIKVKKSSTETNEISIDNNGTSFLIKKQGDKYYLSHKSN